MSIELAIFQALVLPLGIGLGIAAVEIPEAIKRRREARENKAWVEAGGYEEAAEQMKRELPDVDPAIFDNWAKAQRGDQ